MKRRDFLRTSGLAAVGASALPLDWVSAAEKKPQKILYYTRSTGYEHSAVRRDKGELSVSEKALIAMGKRAGFEVTCTKDGRVFDGDLDQYDAFAFYSCGNQCVPGKRPENKPMTPEGKKRLLDAVAGGKGFVGFHSGADTFHSSGSERSRRTPWRRSYASLSRCHAWSVSPSFQCAHAVSPSSAAAPVILSAAIAHWCSCSGSSRCSPSARQT